MASLGYQFRDDSLLELALSHRSIGKQNNERLEFLGDSILSFIISNALYQQFPEAKEGQLSQMRARLVKGKTLAQVAKTFAMGDYLLLGPGELKSGGHRRESILADSVEAIIGAIYLDSELATVEPVVLQWFKGRLDAIVPDEQANKDAKTQLQEWLQARKQPLPVYQLVNTTGSDHQQHFEVECHVGVTSKPFQGAGQSRRAAEQDAAKSALATLQEAAD